MHSICIDKNTNQCGLVSFCIFRCEIFWLGDWMLSLGLSVSDINILIKRLILLLFLGEFLD